MSNTQHKLDKARPPRVQITYDVEVGDAQTAKELPLVVGVMGDFTQTTNTLRERTFINIDKDNFNEVMASMKPEVDFLVENTLSAIEGKLAVSLTFKNIDDFTPDNIVLQVEPLRKLMELRDQLSDLRNRAASNERLKEQLAEMVQMQSVKQSPNTTQIEGEE